MTEPLAVLLLPCRLEDFELGAQASDLLGIPRVIALEPPGRRAPRFLRDSVPLRQAKRVKFPGEPRVLVLYHPLQYPLARALCGRWPGSELWYIQPNPGELVDTATFTREEQIEFDELARARAVATRPAEPGADPSLVNEPLRLRLRELEIISARVFIPGAKLAHRIG